MQLKYIELPEGLRVVGNQYFMSCESLETVTPVVANPLENSIILPSSVVVIGRDSFNDAFKVDAMLNLIRVPAATVKIDQTAFANHYCSVENFEIGTSTEGSNLYLVHTRNILDNTGSVTGAIYNHNGDSTTTYMTFYYKTEAQYNGFVMLEGNFTEIQNRNYVQVN